MDNMMEQQANPRTPTDETYYALQFAFNYFNDQLFGNQLPPCMITMQREKRTFGYYSKSRWARQRTGQHSDEIAMNPEYFAVRTIEETLSVLVHEMAHEWQFHFGKPGRRGYHNREWADKMEALGLMPSDTGRPGGKRTGERMSHYIIEGGAFDVKCGWLLNDGFRLAWFDRYPARMKTELPGDPDEPMPEDPDDPDRPRKPVLPGIEQGDDTDALGIVLPPAEPVDRSNRVKYVCSGCQAAVWGKPKLNLICGDCDGVVFMPEKKMPAEPA